MQSLFGRELIASDGTTINNVSFVAQNEFVVAPGVTVKLQDGTVLQYSGNEPFASSMMALSQKRGSFPGVMTENMKVAENASPDTSVRFAMQKPSQADNLRH